MQRTWDKIVKVEGEQWHDQTGSLEYEILWIVTKNAVYTRSLQIGDTIESLVKHYQTRGLTDSKCRLHREKH